MVLTSDSRRGEPGPGRHAGPYCVSDHNDDFIGRARIDLCAQDLEARLPNVGDEYVETVVLNHCSGSESVCDVTYGPDYSFTYRITGLPDVRVGLHGVLDEAMRRSGARSELEAHAIWIQFVIHSDTELPTCSFSYSRTFHKPLYGKEIV